MKKVALCLHGYFNSLKDHSSLGLDGYEHIKRNILNYRTAGYQIDIFFHSWEPNLLEKICDLYDPVLWISEEQIDFNKIAKEHCVSREDLDLHQKLGSWSLTSRKGAGYVGPERILSHFYSVQKSVQLCKDWEKKNNFKYDCIIKSRFDLGRINRKYTGPNQKNPPVQCINFNPEFDMDFFYQAYWDLFNEGPADMWFYSSSENMKHFCSLYDKTLKEYLKKGSDYSTAVVQGWVESRINNFRSNESLKEVKNRSTELHKYPEHMVCNAILLYKWFLIDNGLWQRSKPLKTEWE